MAGYLEANSMTLFRSGCQATGMGRCFLADKLPNSLRTEKLDHATATRAEQLLQPNSMREEALDHARALRAEQL
jgi:hypothetical protein